MDDKARFRVRITQINDAPDEKRSDARGTITFIVIFIGIAAFLAFALSGMAVK